MAYDLRGRTPGDLLVRLHKLHEAETEAEARLETIRDDQAKVREALAPLVEPGEMRQVIMSPHYKPRLATMIRYDPSEFVSVTIKELEDADKLTWPEPASDPIDVEFALPEDDVPPLLFATTDGDRLARAFALPVETPAPSITDAELEEMRLEVRRTRKANGKSDDETPSVARNLNAQTAYEWEGK